LEADALASICTAAKHPHASEGTETIPLGAIAKDSTPAKHGLEDPS